MRNVIIFLLFIIMSSLSRQTLALPVGGYDVPERAVFEETGDVLALRGIAFYKQHFEDAYIGAFYSLNFLTSSQQALQDKGAKRMWIYFLQSQPNFKEVWNIAINENNSPLIVQQQQINISQFIKMIDYPLHQGDVLVLDYVPNVGTKVIHEGALKGVIKGEEFYPLILKVWMGRQPPSKKFRKELFNLTQGIHI